MKKIPSIVAIAALLMSGCATYCTTDAGGKTTINIENTGWYMFSFIPIASGEPDCPNENCCRWFTTTTTLENNMKILRHAMLNEGAIKAENVVTHHSDEKVFVILLKRYSLHTSAELIK